MVVSDLDGTLTRSDLSICSVDIQTLKKLGDQGVCRVIATGRNLFSVRKVLTDDFPVDFLIFSSGTGIMNWDTQEIIHSQHMPGKEVEQIASVLLEHRVDFCIQDKTPDNHRFSYILHNQDNNDFKRRLKLCAEFIRPFEIDTITDASQIIAILGQDVERFNQLCRLFEDANIIRATSPLDGKTIWMEFFPRHVSKAYGVDYLCQRLGIDRDHTVGIGNDYNDLDLLNYCKHSFLVANAPEELKQKYPVVASNDMNGFSQLIDQLGKAKKFLTSP